MSADETLTAEQVLRRYMENDLSSFVGIEITDVNQRGHYGDTPLNIACVRGKIAEVKALLAAGADVNVKGEMDNTPLHNAAGQGHADVVRLLLEMGADPKIRNEDGYTAAFVAALMNHNKVVKVLDSFGRTDT